MKRREFIVALAGTMGLRRIAFAEPANKTRLVGWLGTTTPDDPVAGKVRPAFNNQIRDLGWVEGQNLQIERRSAHGDPDRANELAKELVGLAPDVILATSSLTLAPLARQTRTIPIVFAGVGGPVEQGYIANMARPEGNLTGFTNFTDIANIQKLVELLKEILPSVSRVALMINPDRVGRFPDPFQPMEVAATSLGVEPVRAPVRTTLEIESTIAAFAPAENAGMIVLPDNFVNLHRELVIQTVAKHRLPTVYPFGFWAREGGLIGYGNDLIEPYRLAATYVDRILRGAKVGELPVQQPTKLELVINLKTAKALELVVPPTLLVRADEVIE